MSAALIEQFDLLATSTGGIAKLRELILSLAVRGQLVPQDPNDEPASELLRKIRAEKDRLIAEGKIKRDKQLAEIGEDEKPFELPAGWEWVRFGEYSHEVCTGPFGSMIHKEDYVSGGIPLINPSHMIDGLIKPDFDVSLPREKVGDFSAYQLSEGDIVLARRGEVGRYAIVTSNEDGWLCGTGSFFVKFSSEVSRAFLGLLFLSSDVRVYLQGESVGTTMVNLNQKILLEMLVGIPPLAEQSRIVAKVEELMALCDRLEAEQGHAARVQWHWVEAALDQLAESADADEFRRHWQHLAEHFDTLFTTPASIERLNATLLQLAVRGKLVSQDEGDEDATSYLAETTAQNYTGLPALPARWTWARVDETGRVDLGRQRAPQHHNGPNMRPYLRVQNVYEARIDTSDIKEMNFTPSEFETFALKPGDVLLNEGQSRELVGRPAIYRGEVTNACFQNTLVRYRHYDFVIPEYALIVFRSYLRSGRFQQISKQTTNIAHLSAGRFATMEFPLPPKSEQLRIVTQVEKLLALTAELKAHLSAAQTKQAHLAETLIAEVV